MTERLIRLWDLEGVAVVIEMPSGVLYTNQVGGTFCLQECVEGVLAPIKMGSAETAGSLAARLRALFVRNPVLSARVADELDVLLASSPGAAFLRVDPEKTGTDDGSVEAWVHVDLDEPRSVDAVEGFGRAKGVLTWENSD